MGNLSHHWYEGHGHNRVLLWLPPKYYNILGSLFSFSRSWGTLPRCFGVLSSMVNTTFLIGLVIMKFQNAIFHQGSKEWLGMHFGCWACIKISFCKVYLLWHWVILSCSQPLRRCKVVSLFNVAAVMWEFAFLERWGWDWNCSFLRF